MPISSSLRYPEEAVKESRDFILMIYLKLLIGRDNEAHIINRNWTPWVCVMMIQVYTICGASGITFQRDSVIPYGIYTSDSGGELFSTLI